MTSKRHTKPTAAALSERTYRKVLALRTTLLNQMALIRLDIVSARREDREHMKTLADHCARLLREKETLQRQLTIEIGKSYTVTREEVIDETDWSATIIHAHPPGMNCTDGCRTITSRPQL